MNRLCFMGIFFQMSRNYKIRNQDQLHFLTLTVVKWMKVFNEKRHIDVIVNNLNYCIHNKGLEVYAWCLMPDHLHLIARAQPSIKLQDIIRDFKKFTSKRMIECLRENTYNLRNEKTLYFFRKAGESNSNNTYYQFWQQHNHPIELYREFLVDQKLEYIHMNPVKAGLVKEPEDYELSSARDYCGVKGLVDVVFV